MPIFLMFSWKEGYDVAYLNIGVKNEIVTFSLVRIFFLAFYLTITDITYNIK